MKDALCRWMFMSSFFKISRNFHSRCTKGRCGKTPLACDLKRQGCFQGCADEKCREQKEGFMWERFKKHPEALFVLRFSLIFFICFIPFSQSQRITAEKVWEESLQSGKSRLWHIMASIGAGACKLHPVRFCFAYLLPVRQTETAPEDVPWLLPTGTAQWPAAATNKQVHMSAHTHTPKIPHKHSEHTMFTRALYFKPHGAHFARRSFMQCACKLMQKLQGKLQTWHSASLLFTNAGQIKNIHH